MCVCVGAKGEKNNSRKKEKGAKDPLRGSMEDTAVAEVVLKLFELGAIKLGK